MSFQDFLNKGYLAESPFIIPHTNFELDKSDYNSKLAVEFLAKVPSEVLEEKENHYILSRYGDWNDGQIVLIDTEEKEIMYLVEFKKIKLYNTLMITQSKVWRSNHSPLVNIVSKIFEILLNHNKIICSDSEQTENGRDFWLRRMSDAANNNLFVGLLEEDMSEDTIEWFDPKEQSYIKWIKLHSDKWNSTDIDHTRFRFVISKEKY